MNELQKNTIKLSKRFSSLKKKEYIFMDLVEEVGELSTDIMYYEKFKAGRLTGKVTKNNIADSLCDIIFDVFLIADQYRLNLNKEYKKMLMHLEKRANSGEFKSK